MIQKKEIQGTIRREQRFFARCVCPTQDTSCMETVLEKQEDEADTIIIAKEELEIKRKGMYA